MLYPYPSSTRCRISLGGMWDFEVPDTPVPALAPLPVPAADVSSKENKLIHGYFTKPQPMAVPASYNDIGVDASLRDHVGDVWYKTTFYVPAVLSHHALWLRFGSVSHNATVWVNGQLVAEHAGGFLPFEAHINAQVRFDGPNTLVVRVNNQLTWQTLPPGGTRTFVDAEGVAHCRHTQQHDFFNYAGIHRPVWLYAIPLESIRDITVRTRLSTNERTQHGERAEAHVTVQVAHSGGDDLATKVRLLSRVQADEHVCAEGDATSPLQVSPFRAWSPDDPFLYTLEVSLWRGPVCVDVYELPVGLRTIAVQGDALLLNGKPLYLKGFGKHEDSHIRGKGHDDATNLRDMHLLRWTGANSFRTSHYPYSEEMLDLCDRFGMLVIDEVPAVGMLGQSVPAVGELDGVFTPDKINDATLKEHQRTLTELIARDKNHPSVIVWSLANEASTAEPAAGRYFEHLARTARALDDRPLTLVNIMLVEPGTCQASKHVDLIGLNLYFGWYSERGDIASGAKRLKKWLEAWHKAEGKPLFLAEYGADTVAGLHKLPSVMFSEEFQVEFLEAYHQVLDQLPFVIGEHVWNFADFQTGQDIVRVDGNKKGVFTRERQPKMAAHMLRQRWIAR